MLKERDKEDFTQEYEAHLKRKEEARSVKTADKAHSFKNNNFMSATFDMLKRSSIGEAKGAWGS